MNLGEQVFEYCERKGAELYAEPLNSLSNLAFFYFAWKLWTEIGSRSDPRLAPLRLLAVLIAFVGAGSLAFHTLATRWASILDVLFIGIFNVCYLILFLRRIPRWSTFWAFAGGVGFVIVDRSAGAFLPGDAFNGSILYLPALVVLIALTACAVAIAPESGRRMLRALAVFVVSLTARTLDRSLCASWSWGTHFVWHLLNAWVLYQLSLALLPARDPPESEGKPGDAT